MKILINEEKNHPGISDFHHDVQWIKNIDFCCCKMSTDFADGAFLVTFSGPNPFLEISRAGHKVNLCPYCGAKVEIAIKKVK